MTKARIHVCSRAISGSNVPSTGAVTSSPLYCCCPLLLNLNGLDLALQTVLVFYPLPEQRGQTFVRCRACSIQKQLHGKNGIPTEGRGSCSPAAGGGGGGGGSGSPGAGGGGGGSGSPAAGGGRGGGSPETGTGGRGGECEGSSPAAGVDGGGDSGSTAADGGGEASGGRSPAAGAGGHGSEGEGSSLQQACMEAATAAARQQSWAAQQSWAKAAATEARQQTEVQAAAVWQQTKKVAAAFRQQAEAGTAVAVVTAEQQQIAELTRAWVELAAEVNRLGDYDVDSRRLPTKIDLLVGGVFLHNHHGTHLPVLTTP